MRTILLALVGLLAACTNTSSMYTVDAIQTVTDTVKTEFTYVFPVPGDDIKTCHAKLWRANQEVLHCHARSNLTRETGQDIIHAID